MSVVKRVNTGPRFCHRCTRPLSGEAVKFRGNPTEWYHPECWKTSYQRRKNRGGKR